MRSTTPRTKARGALSALFIASLALASCSSAPAGDTPSPEPAVSSDSPAAPGAEVLAAAYEGTVGAPPTEAVPVPEDLSAWIVSCGQSQTTCSTPAQAAADAAEAIGWQQNVCDGQLNPNGWASCIRQGVAANADVILVMGQDCSSFQGPLEEARAAGIVTVGVGANDCDIDGGDPLYTGITKKLDGLDNEQWWNKIGELQANWLMGQTGGDVKLLEVTFADARFGPWISDGLNAALADCETCEVVGTLQLGNQDAAAGAMGQKLSTALLQAPEANAIAVPLDGWFMAGLSQAIVSSQRSDDLAVIGTFGQRSNLDLIADGQGQDASVAFSLEWDGWSGIDTALRLLAGQEILASGVGQQVVDATTNMPADGSSFAYNPEIDFRKAYLEAWGK
ncbi:substrate-binding domain-containing protein [Arthrobacter sp. zg-Y916]|uniref:Substrate-binding domain-containing protein n=1 Tax=Arthrobacter caoxuetaonis TaxID=2886935 RepID=A0A9X1MEN9_9MICC|nr:MULTISPECIES: substrate-binding domain-containing protein [Arthrobacter]MCC3298386.1 substrate-binding domain-containing protein [Arthrobacter caoxuetaonis]MCC9195146.1 substrate-binding domain-containing protein [Arthrobacter sp. zg-Y916]USQ57598.1 substrate-binding domain-containing protein [Arthrobacter caoxuetaonis]